MSTRILLPCSPPPHRPAERPVAPLGRAPALISLGPFSSYAACQVPASKTPLLKTRRATQSPGFPHSTSENGLSFTPAGVGIHLREVTASLRNHSPTRQILLTPEGSPLKVTPPPPVPSRRPRLEEVYQLPDASLDLKKPFLPPNSRLPSRKTSVSSSSSSPLSPLSPASPGGAIFPRRLPSPSTPKILLKKSQSALIMPSLLTLLRPDTAPSVAPPPDGPDFPSPIIRKCQTMVSLSGNGASDASTPSPSLSTKVVKERRGTARLGLLRRISSSKSAVFSSSASKSAVLRKSSSVAIHRYRKGSSVGMEPHPEHPDETKPPTVPSAHEPEDGSRHSLGEDVTESCSGLKERSPHDEERVPLGGGCSRCTSVASLPSRRHSVVPSDGVFCKLCLSDVSVREMYQLQQCQCRFCTYCMCMHATLKIREGEPTIECPDSNCDCQGELTLDEVESLVGKELLNLHLRFRRDREIELDPLKTWCPKPSCDTVVCLSLSKLEGRPQCCSCPTCNTMFCGSCSSPWHPGKPCNHIVAQLLGVPLNESIKRCPRCKVPIERDAGCAQMQCKKCKHVFCWYCLASLEDDFLLRHYDKGPCKNKLGHSRASVLWHRAQVVVIFAGFGLLLVIASPLLLFVGPCLLCRSCRPCSTGRLDSDEEGNTGL